MAYDADFGDGGDRPHEEQQAAEVERLCRQALVRLEDDDPDGAREIAMEAVALDEHHPFPPFVLGLVAEHEGDVAAACYLSDKALRAAPANADLIQFRAELHLRAFEFEEAERLLRWGVVHNPDDASLHETIARVLLARGETGEALQEAQMALRLDETSPAAHAVRAAALEEAGDTETMLAVLRQAVQMHPTDPYTMVELAGVEAEHGNIERSRRLLARAHMLAPHDDQVAQVRHMIEASHDHPLLQPLPLLLRWVRGFPGGLAGFLGGFVVAALPLHPLVQGWPEYLLPVSLVMGAWLAVASYVWLGPAVLTARLNRAAGRGMRDRAARQGAPLPPAMAVEAAAMLYAGRAPREALTVLEHAAAGASSHDVTGRELEQLIERMHTRGTRLHLRVASMPGDVRALVAAAAFATVATPVLAGALGIEATALYAGIAVLLMVAALIVRADASLQRDLAAAAGRISASAGGPASEAASHRAAG